MYLFVFFICVRTHINIYIILECESVRSGTPIKLDDVSGYGTADSCSDKTPPYLPTNRGHQQPFESILREDSRTDFSSGSSRSARVGDKISKAIVAPLLSLSMSSILFLIYYCATKILWKLKPLTFLGIISFIEQFQRMTS